MIVVFNDRNCMKRVIQNFGLFLLSSVIILLVMEGLSRIFVRVSQTHIVDINDNITSMQVDPGDPAAGLIPGFIRS